MIGSVVYVVGLVRFVGTVETNDKHDKPENERSCPDVHSAILLKS